MSELALSIPLVIGLLVALAAAAGAGYIVYGASLYLTAAERRQRRGGRSAMLFGLAGLALALAAFGLAELLIDPAAALPASIEAGPFHLYE